MLALLMVKYISTMQDCSKILDFFFRAILVPQKPSPFCSSLAGSLYLPAAPSKTLR